MVNLPLYKKNFSAKAHFQESCALKNGSFISTDMHGGHSGPPQAYSLSSSFHSSEESRMSLNTNTLCLHSQIGLFSEV